ncbi:MAG: hypothetical protein OXF88_07410 [Rhodobacteraceae bacterium]|nr:hypothetical protein [Paracoccaceae bacterium]MCY4138183.1 hypothetical protein [Paracoccaceae bacterium]
MISTGNGTAATCPGPTMAAPGTAWSCPTRLIIGSLVACPVRAVRATDPAGVQGHRAAEGDQGLVVEAAPTAAAIFEVPGDVDDDRVEMLWRRRVEEVPYLVATGDRPHSQERGAVRETAAFREQLLMDGKGGRPGDECGKAARCIPWGLNSGKIVENQRGLHFRITTGPPEGQASRNARKLTV